MKKIILILIAAFIITNPAFAACDYTSKCAPKPYDLSSKFNQRVSKYTGVTFLTEKLAQSIIKGEIKKETKENFKVKVKSYSAADLAGGRFKSLSISGKNLEIEGTYLTSLEIKTLCDFNYVQLDKKSIKFKENMVVDFKTVISDTDLRKTMQSSGYLKDLNSVNLSAFGMTVFKLSGADVAIKNNKMYFTIKVTSALFGHKPLNIVVASDVKVEDGKIVLTKIDLVTFFTRLNLSDLTYLLNAINPLNFSLDILSNKDSKMQVQSVDITGDRITVNGTVFIPKNYTK